LDQEKIERDEMTEEMPKNHENEHGWIPEPSPINDGRSDSSPSLETQEQPDVPSQPVPLQPAEERTWAMLAHLSVLLNLITGFLGTIAAIILYFTYKDRSRLVAYHAMQSFIFQTITWLGAGILAGLFIGFGSAFAFLILPILCLIPGFLFLLFIPISVIYGVIGGVKVNNGEDFSYWQVGDWVRDILEPKPIQ
jgi:hypothetical protein